MPSYKAYFTKEKQIRTLGFDVERSGLIHQFTDGRKTSLKDLSNKEYYAFLNWLDKSFEIGTSINTDWQNSPANRMRRKVYSLFVYKMHYTEERLQEWCKKYGKFKKPLNDHTEEELVELVTQAEKVHESFISEIKK